MQEIFNGIFSGIRITDVIDILIVAFAIYKLLEFIRETRAAPVSYTHLMSGQDLIDNGRAEGKKVGELLFMLTDVVHRKPHENTKEALLGYARKYSRNKFAAAIRNVGLLNKK